MAAFASTTSADRLLAELTRGVRAGITINMNQKSDPLLLFTCKLEKALMVPSAVHYNPQSQASLDRGLL